MSLRLATATRNTALASNVALLDSGSIEIRTGAQPTDVDDPAQGTLLGTLAFSPNSFGTPTDGTAAANAISSDTAADASGTAGHARLLGAGDVIHSDCTCGQGSGDISFDNNVIVAGGTIAISSMTITQPA